jgi:hypothetical protein
VVRVTGLEHAILGLRQALETPRRHGLWRWLVRHRISQVKDALKSEGGGAPDGWLAAREAGLHRDAALLLNRLNQLAPQIGSAPDVDPLRLELVRLVTDLEHHRQRLNDLVYDSVSLELGGSE